MPTIKIPNGSGGWIKFPTIKGDKGDKGDPGNTPTWNDIIGKPSTFPPSTHSHDDKYYTESEIDIKLTSKAESSTVSGHTGNSTVHVTSTDKSNWNAKVNTDDSRLSDARIPLSHNHTKSNITDFAHTHLITDLPPYPTLASLGASASTHNHSLNSLSEKSYTSLTDKPTIPTKLSELEADVELGGNFATIGTVKPTDGSMWYEEI